MRRGIKKRGLKVRRYAEHLIKLSKYLASFHGATFSDKIGVTESNFFSETVCLIAGLIKPMCKDLILNLFSLRKLLTCLSVCRFPNQFTEVQQNLIIKPLPRNIPTMMVKSGIIEEKMPCHRLTPRWVRAPASSKNDIQITQQVNQKAVSFTAPGILLMNARSWQTLVISKLKVNVLSTMGIIPYQGKFNRQQENSAIVNNVVD